MSRILNGDVLVLVVLVVVVAVGTLVDVHNRESTHLHLDVLLCSSEWGLCVLCAMLDASINKLVHKYCPFG